MAENNLMSLNLSADMIKPIIEKTIQANVLSALNGWEGVVADMVNAVLTTKVDKNGNISDYSSENRYSWVEANLNRRVKELVEDEVKKQIEESAEAIRDAVRKQITSKAGSNAIAKAVVDGFIGTFEKSWNSRIDISFAKNED
jgi:hypothetical protein